MNNIHIKLKEKQSGFESQEVSFEDIIYSQHDIEFEFNKYMDDGVVYENGTLPYNDFLYFRDDYEVIIVIKGELK